MMALATVIEIRKPIMTKSMTSESLLELELWESVARSITAIINQWITLRGQ